MQYLDQVPVTEPTSEPVALATLKMHARVDSTDEDANLSLYAIAVRRSLERQLGISFLETEWDEYLDRFPCANGIIQLSKSPLISITSITYTNMAGQPKTLTEGVDFVVDSKSQPPRIAPKYGMIWPVDVEIKPAPIRIRYKAGFTTVPKELIIALCLSFTDSFENRSSVVGSESYDVKIPTGLSQLLTSNTVWGF